jgi:hypothetical protein
MSLWICCYRPESHSSFCLHRLFVFIGRLDVDVIAARADGAAGLLGAAPVRIKDLIAALGG